MSDEVLPPGWAVVDAGALIERIDSGKSEQTLDRRPKGDERGVVKVSAVTWGEFDPSEAKAVRPERFINAAAVASGDLLVSRANTAELVAAAVLVDRAYPNLMLSDKILRLHLRDAVVDKRFMLAALRRREAREYFAGQASGTSDSMRNVSQEKLRALPVPLAPLKEQRRIVAKLDALLSRSKKAREHLAHIPKLLEALKRSFLAAAFRGDLTADWRAANPGVEPAGMLRERILAARQQQWDARRGLRGKAPSVTASLKIQPFDADMTWDIPTTWTWASIDEVGEIQLGRQRAPQYALGKGARPYLRVANIKDDRIDYEDVLSMDFDESDFERYALRPDDILLSEGQSLSRVGESAIYDGRIPGLCYQKTLHRFRRREPAPSAAYCQLVFRHHVHNEVFRHYAPITTNIAHLTLERIKTVPFPLAPAAEQQVLVDRLRACLSRIDMLANIQESLISQTARAERSVLGAAFRGAARRFRSERRTSCGSARAYAIGTRRGAAEESRARHVPARAFASSEAEPPRNEGAATPEGVAGVTSESPPKKAAKARRTGKTAVQPSLDFEAVPEAVPSEGKKLKTSAPGQSLGFSLQQTRMVARLLEADAGDVVSLEVFDDVGVEKADGTVIAEQGKSTLGYNPLTDRSPPFWKTIANWLDAIEKKVLDVNVTWFEIYVSRNVSPGPICKSFEDANDATGAAKAVADAKAILWGTAPQFEKRKDVAQELGPQLERVFKFSDAAVAAMIARMHVVLGSGNPHDDIEPLLKKKLVSDDGYENVVRWALGWVKKETDLMIQRGEPARISCDVFQAALLEYVRLHDRNTALRSVAGMPAKADVERELAMRTYVDQLDLVNTPDEDVFAAITDYLRASTDRTHWAEKGFIDGKALDAFAEELEVVWRNHKRKLDIVHKSALPPERGLLIFTECNGHTAALSGLACPAHFTRGSFHALADMERIGWHPDYAAELKRLRDERAAETKNEGGDDGAPES